MKRDIIVTTDFSAAAANALSYACKFARDYDLNILLVHIYTIPVSYAAEGLSIAAINDSLDTHREKLKAELERAQSMYTRLHIEASLITGDYLESLHELKKSVNPALIIMGTVMDYSDLWQWSDDWLNALISVSCPVLVIPQHIAYSPIMRIAFAADNKNECLPEQITAIKRLVNLSNAHFYIVHVTPSIDAEDKNNQALSNDVFNDLNPQYHTVENRSVIKGVAEFVQQYHIDLLIVIPHKHGLWHSLFNKSYTKQLALLNNLPVMAINNNN